MTVGLMPYDKAVEYGISVSRKVVYTSSWLGWFASPYKDKILLNINNSSTGAYTTNPDAFAKKAVKIYNTLDPELVTIENEELLHGDIKTYCAELTAAAKVLPVTNGGLTTGHLSAWYYKYNQWDTDFFKCNVFQKDAFLSGGLDDEIRNTEYELNVLKGLNIPFVNVHYYIGNSNQVEGLVRLFNTLSGWIGKPLISNEAGIYVSDLLPSVVDIAARCEMKYLILYSGTGTEGSGKALPISNLDFVNAVK